MKATQINPVNVSISLIYCVFTILSFFILKIISRYFHKQKQQKLETDKGKLKDEDIKKMNFSKILIKTYLIKNTLIGSIINNDKKYLLREMLVLSCIGVSCFNVNSYILWPWTVGFGVFIISFIILQVLIPMMDQKCDKLNISQSQQCSQKKVSSSIIDSNSIQIQHTDLQLSVSVQRQAQSNRYLKDTKNVNNTSQQQIRPQSMQRKEKLNLSFILIMAVIAQILFCQSILTLSLSVSNSGVLNMVSFGLAVAIDQFVVRIGVGLVSFVGCFILYKLQTVNLLENHIFLSYCNEYLAQEIKKVQTQRIICQMQKKITKINNPQIHQDCSINDKFSDHIEEEIHQISTQMKMVLPCIFQELFQENPVINSNILPVDAVLQQEPQLQSQIIEESQDKQQSLEQQAQQEEAQGPYQKQPAPQETQQVIIKKQQVQIDTKSETNYFELFQNDIQIFDASKVYEDYKIIQVKKPKKKYHQSQPKFKSDPLLYFPYEQHKLTHKISVQQQQSQQNSQQQSSRFSRERSTIDNNYLSTIEIVDCTEDSVIREEPQINLILQQQNLNIKNLVVNHKPLLLPTSRPGYSEKKNITQNNQNIKSIKKVSPYFVNLSSQAVKPKKIKKIHVSKNNKQNANQTNKSFMTSQAINLSRITQKDMFNFATINNQNLTLQY